MKADVSSISISRAAGATIISRIAGATSPARFFLRLLILGLAIAFLSANALGQAVEIRVASVSGNVIVSGKARTSSPLQLGELLASGDVIETANGGRVRLELTDGSVVIVQPQTRIILQDYHSAGSLRDLLKISVGRVRIKINRFGSQPNPYRVNSPTASIAVRGTEFGVTVSANGDTQVMVYEGLVEVSSLFNPQRRVLVEPGRGVIIRLNDPIQFFMPGLGNQISEREESLDESNQTGNATTIQGSDNRALRSATGVYERYIDSIVDSGELLLSSRFAAFPDSHLDSLENPSYATEFTKSEGRFFLLPSVARATQNDAGQTFIGFDRPRPVDYNLAAQASFFKPLPKYRATLGGSLAFSRNGIQSFTLDENIALPSPPFLPAATGSRANLGSTTNNFFAASLVAARQFGADGRTSFGVGLDFLSQRGTLFNQINQFDASGRMQRESLESHSRIQRTRFTVGLTREMGKASKLGVFYRYGYASAKTRNRLGILDDAPLPLELTGETGNSSELGVRFRGSLTRRLFYGIEGSVLFGKGKENIERAVVVDTYELSKGRRATLGFGIGYALRPRTVLSFDVSGGLARTRSLRRQVATGNPLEDEREKVRFLSLHTAVQADVWRRMFVSGSVLSVIQSRVTGFQPLADGFGKAFPANSIFASGTRSRSRVTDYFSNFGIGWRFTPNYLAEYIFSTDFGHTSPRHTLLLRYTFNRGEK